MATVLQGIDQISDYCRKINIQYSIQTIMDGIRFRGFPARKLGGRWTSDTALIDKWARGEHNETQRKVNKSMMMQRNKKHAKKRG